MFTFAPTYLAGWTGGRWLSLPTVELHGFTQDTRQLKPGQVFVALKTAVRDGHDFLPAAVAAGASAAIVSRPDPALALPQLVVADPLAAFQAIAREHRRHFLGPVVGVTGSCGKTSTKNLLARLLGGESRVLATEGNLNNFLGVPLTLTRLEPGVHEVGIVEAGISEPGEMDLLGGMIQPDYGVVTLVAPAHTQDLGGIDGVAREKAVMLQHIRPNGLGVFPKQCWDFAAFQDLPQASVVVVPAGEKISAPRTVSFDLSFTAEKTEAHVGRRRFVFRRVSRGMAQNAVLAIVLASELGATDDAISLALEGWEPAKWRGEVRREGGRLLYLDFYNANPASMADALDAFLSIAPAGEPRLFVLGCMEELGPDSARHHRELGRSLRLRPGDRAFVIGGEADEVIAGAAEAGLPEGAVLAFDAHATVAAEIAGFRGAVFIKGSRRHALEKVLPAPAEPLAAGGGGGHARGGPANIFACGRSGPVASLPTSWRFPQVAARTGRSSLHPFF